MVDSKAMQLHISDLDAVKVIVETKVKELKLVEKTLKSED
jgi:hypothetical protein